MCPTELSARNLFLPGETMVSAHGDRIGRKKGGVNGATPPESSATGLTDGLCFCLGLRFGVLTAFRRKLSNHSLLQLFDINAIPLGSIRE